MSSERQLSDVELLGIFQSDQKRDTRMMWRVNIFKQWIILATKTNVLMISMVALKRISYDSFLVYKLIFGRRLSVL